MGGETSIVIWGKGNIRYVYIILSISIVSDALDAVTEKLNALLLRTLLKWLWTGLQIHSQREHFSLSSRYRVILGMPHRRYRSSQTCLKQIRHDQSLHLDYLALCHPFEVVHLHHLQIQIHRQAMELAAAGSTRPLHENMYGRYRAPSDIAWPCHGQQTWSIISKM